MKDLIDAYVIIDTENIFLSSANSRFDGYISAKTIADIYILHLA